jgi:hypothetical protein
MKPNKKVMMNLSKEKRKKDDEALKENKKLHLWSDFIHVLCVHCHTAATNR